jgi:glyoxylase-like metal-dependent hydrolase (beta-lactamase superfamily II)
MQGPTQIAPGIHGLGTEMVNWYLIEDAGRLTAVDAGLPGFAATLEPDLRGLGFAAGDVEAVVLTHSDGDHTGLAPRFRDAGARVLIHAADAAALRKPGPKKGHASPRHVLGNLWRREARTVLVDTLRHGGAKPSKVADPETYADGDILDVPGRPRVIHTPGHTAGHCALLLEDRGVLFVGDALITHELIAKNAGVRLMPRFTNEDNAACFASLSRLETVDADLVLVGHGDPWRGGTRAAAERARAVARDAPW